MELESENELINFEDDLDDDLDSPQSLERYRDAVLYGTDWTVRTLLQQIEQGNIDLSPNFQRRDAWSIRNKSRFIESVALQLPIPQIVLAERKEQRGTYIVLDGKQRLLTLAQFAGNFPKDHKLWKESSKQVALKLSGLKVLNSLNGKTYTDLMAEPELTQILTQFDNHTIRSALIRNWPDDDYLYEVFIRLNTGSARLSPQELRQAMKPGEFTEFLSTRSADSKALQRILGISGPDFRMRDVDLLLRLIAFLTRLPNYKGNLKPFLDDVQNHFNSNWDDNKSSIEELVARIEDGLNFLVSSFGSPSEVGRRWAGKRFETSINRAVLDVQIASALDPRVRNAVQKNRLNIRSAFINVSENDQEFVQSISGTTKSIAAIRSRYAIWQNKLETLLEEPVSFPRLPHG